jgi:hypothetical protein
VSTSVPFGGWSPVLGGLVPSAPPPALISPPEVRVIYSYVQLRYYRMVSQPWMVRVTYDEVQRLLEERIEEMKQAEFQAWAQWCARMM